MRAGTSSPLIHVRETVSHTNHESLLHGFPTVVSLPPPEDSTGKLRGACTQCGSGECAAYQRPAAGNDCDYCGCKPTKHALVVT